MFSWLVYISATSRTFILFDVCVGVCVCTCARTHAHAYMHVLLGMKPGALGKYSIIEMHPVLRVYVYIYARVQDSPKSTLDVFLTHSLPLLVLVLRQGLSLSAGFIG